MLKKIVLLPLLGIAAGFLILCGFLSSQILLPNAPPISQNVDSVVKDRSHLSTSEPIEFKFQDFHTFGVKLTPKEPKGCVNLLMHGFRANHIVVLKYAPIYLQLGCSVYSFDLPAHGNSIGKVLTWGKTELPYLKSIITYVHAMGNSPIGLHGESLGGALAIQLSTLENVSYVIADSSYSKIEDIFLFQGQQRYGVIASTLIKPAMLVTELISGIDFEKVSPYSHVSSLLKPTLIIHSQADEYTPLSHGQQLKDETKNNPWVMTFFTDWGAGHGNSFDTNPKAYKTTVFQFLEKYNKTPQLVKSH